MATKRQAPKSAFKPGTSGNPKGKPAGTRSKSTQLLLSLMEGNAANITQTVITAAKAGDLMAAKIILDGVKADRWRILVGKDAEYIDRTVRAAPEDAYSPSFFEALASGAGWRALLGACRIIIIGSGRRLFDNRNE